MVYRAAFVVRDRQPISRVCRVMPWNAPTISARSGFLDARAMPRWKARSFSIMPGESCSAARIASARRTIFAASDRGGAFRVVCEVEPGLPGNRLNGGVVGPDGVVWVGTMQNNISEDDSPADMTADTGRLYRYAPASCTSCDS